MLQCAVCGTIAPGNQWWNRDTGFGCCFRCFLKQVQREGAAEAIKSYGVPTIHHSTPRALALSRGGLGLAYDDGRGRIPFTVLKIVESGILTQFDDRADTTFIRFDERQWMDHIQVS